MAIKPAVASDTVTTDQDVETTLLDVQTAAVKRLIARGKERGYITFDELNQILPPDQNSSEQIEDVMANFSEMGIQVVESEETEDGEAPVVKTEKTEEGDQSATAVRDSACAHRAVETVFPAKRADIVTVAVMRSTVPGERGNHCRVAVQPVASEFPARRYTGNFDCRRTSVNAALRRRDAGLSLWARTAGARRAPHRPGQK